MIYCPICLDYCIEDCLINHKRGCNEGFKFRHTFTAITKKLHTFFWRTITARYLRLLEFIKFNSKCASNKEFNIKIAENWNHITLINFLLFCFYCLFMNIFLFMRTVGRKQRNRVMGWSWILSWRSTSSRFKELAHSKWTPSCPCRCLTALWVVCAPGRAQQCLHLPSPPASSGRSCPQRTRSTWGTRGGWFPASSTSSPGTCQTIGTTRRHRRATKRYP